MDDEEQKMGSGIDGEAASYLCITEKRVLF